MSTSPRSPTRSRQHRGCWPNSASSAASSSHSMRYTVKKLFDVAAQTGVDLIVQVKSNQPTLQQNITDLAAATAPLSSHHSHDRGRNRDESRAVCVFDPARKIADSDWQFHAKDII